MRRSLRRLWIFLGILLKIQLIICYKYYVLQPKGIKKTEKHNLSNVTEFIARPFNGSFCKFNYGFPEKLDWSQIEVDGTPEFEMESFYRVIYNAIEQTMYDGSYSAKTVTYATYATSDFVCQVGRLAQLWDGPISLAVFVPSYDFDVALKLLEHLCKFNAEMSKVSVHLVYPEREPPILITKELSNIIQKQNIANSTSIKDYFQTNFNTTGEYNTNEGFVNFYETVFGRKHKRPVSKLPSKDPLLNVSDLIKVEMNLCAKYENINVNVTFRSRNNGVMFPINVCRNVAKNASVTLYNMVADVSLIPSYDLSARFIQMLRKYYVLTSDAEVSSKLQKVVFVIPVFGIQHGEYIPRNKASLQKQVSENSAFPYHKEVCRHCLRIPDYETWIREDPGSIVKEFLTTKTYYPYHRWTPIFISTRHSPLYSEFLSWDGEQDKRSQSFKMCLMSYEFVVIDGGFLCRSGPRTEVNDYVKAWYRKHDRIINRQIIKQLAEIYPPDHKCLLHYRN